MKIAICFSGQIRTGVRAAPNILRYIGDLLPNCDFFVQTWDIETYSSTGFSSKFTDDNNIAIGQPFPIDKQTYLDFIKIYNPKISVIDNFDFWKQTRDNVNQNRPDHDPCLYCTYQVNVLKNMYEEMHNFKYDVVVRTRPDLIFSSEKSLTDDIIQIKDDRTFCYSQLFDSEVFDNQIDNAFWLGSSYVMDQVTNFGPIRNNSHPDIEIGPLHDGHRHFGYWVKYGLGFSVVRLQNSRTGIYRQFHIENNINSCDNIAVNTVDRYKLTP